MIADAYWWRRGCRGTTCRAPTANLQTLSFMNGHDPDLRSVPFVYEKGRLGQKDPTRAHVGSVFSESGLSYSGERAYQAPSSFCLRRGLLGLKLRQVLCRGILVLPNDVIL